MKTPILILSALSVSSIAWAQQPSNPPAGDRGNQHSFETLDRNSDGRISATEAQADPALAAKFSTLDKNGKGYITKAEYETHARGERK